MLSQAGIEPPQIDISDFLELKINFVYGSKNDNSIIKIYSKNETIYLEERIIS